MPADQARRGDIVLGEEEARAAHLLLQRAGIAAAAFSIAAAAALSIAAAALSIAAAAGFSVAAAALSIAAAARGRRAGVPGGRRGVLPQHAVLQPHLLARALRREEARRIPVRL